MDKTSNSRGHNSAHCTDHIANYSTTYYSHTILTIMSMHIYHVCRILCTVLVLH